MKTLRLTKNYVTIVDDDIYDSLLKYRWRSIRVRNKIFAIRSMVGKDNTWKENIFLHRDILKAPRGKYIRHLNGNTLDNRKENLIIINL